MFMGTPLAQNSCPRGAPPFVRRRGAGSEGWPAERVAARRRAPKPTSTRQGPASYLFTGPDPDEAVGLPGYGVEAIPGWASVRNR